MQKRVELCFVKCYEFLNEKGMTVDQIDCTVQSLETWLMWSVSKCSLFASREDSGFSFSYMVRSIGEFMVLSVPFNEQSLANSKSPCCHCHLLPEHLCRTVLISLDLIALFEVLLTSSDTPFLLSISSLVHLLFLFLVFAILTTLIFFQRKEMKKCWALLYWCCE